MRHRLLPVLLSRLRPGSARNVGSNQRSTTRIAEADAYTRARVLSLPHERHLKLVPEVQSANDDADSDQHHDGSESDRGAGDGRLEGHGGYTPPRAYRGYMLARGMAIVPLIDERQLVGEHLGFGLAGLTGGGLWISAVA